ncbi:MAG: hypothetical protein GX654_14155 [Desulfatiglans sp.]|nr:hypothetical protein [Desulfatiglans sp.]
MPPTQARVDEMMKGTDLAPDHVVVKIISRMGKATIEKIAVNSVMAGALPTHMPVLIAAVEAVTDPGTRFDTFEVSTGSWAPLLIINGPIRNAININCGSGMMSPWEPLHVAFGYKKESSTVTVMFPNRYTQTIPAQTTAQGVAEALAGMNPGALSIMLVIPDHANVYSKEGWSKKSKGIYHSGCSGG